jgi:MYXO-CTERM domain-containing protein
MRALSLLMVLWPTVGWAHAKLANPTPVNQADDNKNGQANVLLRPCGPEVGTPVVKMWQAGAMLPVEWLETVDHKGAFEFRWAPTGAAQCTLTNNQRPGGQNDGLPNMATTQDAANRLCPTSLKFVDDPTDQGIVRANNQTWKKYSTMVPMPAAPCTGCVLQMIQWMGNATAGTAATVFTPYYSCARIELTAQTLDLAGTGPVDLGGTSSGDDGGSDGGSTMGSADAGTGATADLGPQGKPKSSYELGCAVAGHAPPSSLLALMFLCAVVLVRRRAR